MNNTSNLVIKLNVDNKEYIKGLDRAKSQLDSFSGSLKAIKLAGAGLVSVFAIDRITSQFKEWQTAAEDYTKIHNQMAAIIKATGGAAGLTTNEIEQMASEFQKMTGISDETIKSMQNVLLTFRNIGEDVFPEVTQTVLDMSSVMGTDLRSAALQVGKALNDPKEGMTALRRVGVAFTDEQKKIIDGFLKQGDVASAQKIILQELSREFGGAAAAAKTATEASRTATEDFNEAVGRLFKPAGDTMLEWYTEAIEKATDYIDKIRIINTETDKLSLSEALKKQRELINNIADYKTRFGKYNSEAGVFDMSGLADISPALAENYKRMEAELEQTRKIIPELQKAQAEIKEAGKNYTKEVSVGDSKDESLKQYESYNDSIKARMRDISARMEGEQLLSGLLPQYVKPEDIDEFKTTDVYKKLKEITIDSIRERKEIEVSEATNKAELIAELEKSYALKGSQEITAILEEEQIKRTERLAEQERNVEQKQAENILAIREHSFKMIADSAEEHARRTQELWQSAFSRVFDHSLDWKQKMIGIFSEILMYQAKMALFDFGTANKGAEGWLGTFAKIGLGIAGARADGGDVIAGKRYLVGERGPEIFEAGKTGRIIPNEQVKTNSNSQPIYVNVSPIFQSFDPATGQKMFESWINSGRGKEAVAANVAESMRTNRGGVRYAVRSSF